jgi:glycosyltransferase involved in cell wall biosynthesis
VTPEPAVTVVVPTRNRADLVPATLRSILDQQQVGVRVVVVDEASSDATPAVLASIAAGDDRVEVVRHDVAAGVAGARNDGLARARTPWVAFCDDDDLWAPRKLSAQLQAIAALPGARWSATGAVFVDGVLRVIGHQRPPGSGDVAEAMRMTNAIPGGGSALLARTDLVRDVGGFDPWFTGCEDYGIACALALRSPIATVDEPLVAYRVWDASMSTDVELMRQGHDRVLERYRGDLEPHLALAGDRSRDDYLGHIHVKNGDRFGAARHYAGMARRYREPRRLASAALGLVASRALACRHAEYERAAVPATWRADAEGWLSAAVVAGERV